MITYKDCLNNKYIKYTKYVLKHKWFVAKECIKQGLYLQAFLHDWSKFTKIEFGPYARHFYGKNEQKYKDIAKSKNGYSKISDIEKDVEFDRAWEHHIQMNRHHWQYWVRDGIAFEMPIKYRKEMLCDWIGAAKAQGRTQKSELQDWYDSHKDEMILARQTRRWIEYKIQTM